MSLPYRRVIRPERSFEAFSRGAELLRAIRSLWVRNARLPAGSNREIAERVEALRGEFDLTYDEWYHWSDMARLGA